MSGESRIEHLHTPELRHLHELRGNACAVGHCVSPASIVSRGRRGERDSGKTILCGTAGLRPQRANRRWHTAAEQEDPASQRE